VADYKFVVAEGPDLLGEVQALDKALALRLREPSECSFRINGDHPTAELVRSFDRDVIVYRNAQPLFRGTIGTTFDNVSEERHDVVVSAVDYRGRFERRLLLADETFTSRRDDLIVEDLLGSVQSVASLGVSMGTVEPGPDRTVDFEAGQTLRSAIDTIANVDGGFDWYVDPQLRLNVARTRGEDRGRVLDYGGAVRAVDVIVSSPEYANALRVSGASGTSAVVVANVPTGAARFEGQLGLTTIGDQDVLDAAALRALANAGSQFVSYVIRLRQSDAVQAWGGLLDVDCGDLVTLAIRAGRLDVFEQVRVSDIEVRIGDDGREDVTLTTGIRERWERSLDNVSKRVTSLERQV
jgi:hypothetical protein